MLPWRPAILSPTEIFRFWGNVHPHHHVHAGAQLVASLSGEDFDVHDDAALAVGHLQRGVTDFPGLFAKDGPEAGAPRR